MRSLLRSVLLVPALVIAVGSLPLTVFSLVGGRVGCNGTSTATDRLPIWGGNYHAYCVVCVFALRTFGHAQAIGAVLDSFQAMADSHPETRFVYGEIGWPWGGPFAPHRTHRNGLSVDLMVPLKDGRALPTSISNRFGYDAEFDAGGRGPDGEIDFEAIGAQLLALDEAARDRGGRIRRVILAPDLQDDLAAHPSGAEALRRLTFNRRQAWVRHDDHYHVDLSFPCEEQDARS